MASSFLNRKADEAKKRKEAESTSGGSEQQNRASSFLTRKANEAAQRNGAGVYTTYKENEEVARRNDRTGAKQGGTATVSSVQQKPRQAASQLVNKYQNMAQDMNTEYQVSKANRKTETAQKGVMDAAKRNSLYQSAMSAAQTERAEEANKARDEYIADYIANTPEKKAEKVRARRSGTSAWNAYTGEDNLNREPAQDRAKITRANNPYQVGEVRESEASNEALRQAYKEKYGEEAPEKGVESALKLGYVAAMSGLTQAGAGVAQGVDFMVGTPFRQLEEWGLEGAASKNPLVKGTEWLKNKAQEDVESWVRPMEAYGAAQGSVASKLAELEQEVVANVPQAIIGGMSAGIGAASEASAIAQKASGLSNLSYSIQQLSKNPSFWYTFLTEAGSNYQEALAAGATNDQATVAALTAGLTNATIDLGGDTGGGGLEGLLKKVNAGDSAFLSWISSLLEEGTEEVLQGLVSRATAAAIYDKDAPVFGEGGIIDPAAAWDEFKGGVTVAGVLGGAQIGVNSLLNSAYNRANERAANDQAVEQAIELLRQGLDENGEYQAPDTTAPAVVAENATGAENAQVESPVSATENAQERTFAPEVETINFPENGSISEKTLEQMAAKDPDFWEQVAKLVDDGRAAFDDGGNLYQVNADEHIDQRTAEQVGNRKVKAFQYLHPELHEYYAQAAEGLLHDLDGSTKATRYPTVETGTGYDMKWVGESRNTVEPIARLLDNYGFTYAEIKKGLEDIISNHGSENYAKAKRLELVLDDIMSEGYTDIDGNMIEANPDYIRAKNQIAGAAAQTEESTVRDAETIAQDVRTVNRAATTLGENGSSALRAVYSNESVNSEYSAEDVIQGFTALYNQAQGKKLSATAQARANTMPDIVRSMAESAGLEDTRRAKQAVYFGEKSGIVRDENLKKANLSYKTTRTLDALGKALGVQVRFTDSITDGAGNRAFGSYEDGVISVALDSENPVQSVVMHEAVHRLREVNASSYEALASFVQSRMSESNYQRNIKYTNELYGDSNLDTASEEVVADAFGTILNDSGLLEQFAREHTTVLQRLADSIRDTIRKVNKAVSMESLELNDSEKRRFSDLANELAGMEKTMRNALRTVESQSAGAYNQNNLSQKGQVRNDRVREEQAEGNRGIREGTESSSGKKQQETSYSEGSRTGSGFRSKLAPSAGRQEGVDPAFGEKPHDVWAEGNTVNPTEGSVSYDAQRTAIEYSVPSFVVSESAWNANHEKAPAFSIGGQMYVVENAPERNRGMLAPHEITHIMKQAGFQPYLDFIKRTPDTINMDDRAAQIVLERTAKHRGITLEQLSDALSDPETGFQSNGAATVFFDELNAMVYGHIASGKGVEMFMPGGVLENVFYDFDAYSKELTTLHEQFKAERSRKKKFKLAAPVEESGELVALHNASEDNLLNALELGGLPMPSIAVVKSADGHSKYGPISLVFDKASIDPQADSRNKVYGGDAWTPTAPRVEYQVNEKAATAFEKEIHRLAGSTSVANGIFGNSSVLRSRGIDDTSTQNATELAGKLAGTDTVRAAYLADQGETLEPVMQKKTWNKYGNDVLQAVIDKLGIQKIAEIVAEMETGESAAFSDSAGTIREILEKQLRKDIFLEVDRKAVQQMWPAELTRKKISQQLDSAMEKVTDLTLEDLVQDAWAMYQDGGNTKSETIDRGATADALRKAVDPDKAAQWVKQKLSGVLGEAGIYNGKDPYTASGNRRKFSTIHYSYTLENIVKAMQATQEERGGGIFGLNAETLQSVAAPEYKSVQDIRNDRGRLFMEEEGKRKNRLSEIDFKINEVFSSVQYGNEAHSSNPYIERDNISQAILEAAKGKRTVDAIVKSFRKNGYTISNQTAINLQDIYKAASKIPTGYFEAKPQRAVGFDEVLTAVIPSDSSAQLREGLERAGVPMLEYEAGNESDRLAKVNSVENAKFSRSNKAALDEFIRKYGAFEPGENPSREVYLPRKTAEDKHVSQTVRTIMEAKATPDTVVETLEDMVANGEFSYDSITDKESIARATKKIEFSGWMKTLNEWSSDMNNGKVTKDNTVMGWALYDHAANSGDTATAIDILNMMVKSQRSAAQALQATRVLKQLSPDTQLYQVQRSVQSLQEEINNRYGNRKGPELTINQELAEDFLKADSQAARDAILTDIYRDIGKQLPSTFVDKWNAWRYLAMLGNPRTHVRNVMGNAWFMPVVAAKDLTATAIESAVSRVSGGKLNRTKSLVLSSKKGRALLSAAWGDYAKVQETALSGSKGSDSVNAAKSIEEGRQIFSFKPLEAARKGNSYALDAEDVWFSKPHYAYALASYCNANNISADTIRQGGRSLEQARAYAIKEAQKATYRDTNAFSQMVGNIGGNWKSSENPAKRVVATAVEGILPFRKTPANILARGVEYSPIGLLNGIKQATVDVRKGKATGAQAIDSISAGLTGTGLMGLGVLLASLGKVRGNGGEDDEEKDFKKKVMGYQDYAWQLDDGTSITLDWLAPEALPFFIGVNLWEQTQGKDEEITLSSMLDAVTQVSDPLLEMSMLQSLNDLIDSAGYASSKETSGLAAAAASAATSYLTQALPTIFGQIERTGENIRYTTFVDKNSKWLTNDMQYAVGKASAKIPGVDFQQIPYIDAWGREESTGSTAGRALNNFLNPSYVSKISESDMEKELLRLYDETGEGGVFPSKAAKSFNVDGEEKDLTADEYVKYAKEKGQTSQKVVSELVKSKAYSSMTDADKAKAVKKAYNYANQTAKQKIDSRYEPESWVTKAQEAKKKYGISESQYIMLKIQCSSIGSLKDKNGDTIENSNGLLIMEAVYDTPGLNEEQRKAMFEYLGVGTKVQGYNKTLVREKLAKMRKQAK